MHISLIESSSSNLTHFRGFQLLLLLSWLIGITSFISTKRIDLIRSNQSSVRPIIIAKGISNLPNLLILIKQRSLSTPINLVLASFSVPKTVFSTKVKISYASHLQAATGGVLYKKVFFKKSQISQENTCVRVSF